MKEKIIFIVNPVSGSTSKAPIPKLIKEHVDHSLLDVEIVFTDYAGQGTEIASEAVKLGIKRIIAVGGDGTINEIARVLKDTSSILGIVPAGSGNGLARHMRIPIDIRKAISLLNKPNFRTIDAGEINGTHFFCTSGVGFDAHIGNVFASRTHRGLQGYIVSTLKEFISYKPESYKLEIDGKEYLREAFLITFANAAQYGNNAYISPNASIEDGLLDICILKPFPKMMTTSLGYRLFAKTMHLTEYMEIIQAKEVKVYRTKEGVAHADGEPLNLGKELIVKVSPKCLKIFTC